MSSTSTDPIRVYWQEGQAVVAPTDAERLAAVAQGGGGTRQGRLAWEKFLTLFRSEFLARWGSWLQTHRQHVQSCYIPFPLDTSRLKVFLVTRHPRIDLSLSDEITDLEFELAAQGWPVDIVQLSAASLDELLSFFRPDQSVQVFSTATAPPALPATPARFPAG